MKREPSLHITKSTLYALIIEYSDKLQERIPATDLVEFLMSRGKKYSIYHRSSLEFKSKDKKKIRSITYSTTGAAQMFASLLQSIRKQRKRKGTEIIKEGNKKWSQIKEASELATDFCKTFSLKQREGYIIYINLGMDLMNNYNLLQLNSKHEELCQSYENETLICNDINSDITDEIFNTYVSLVLDKTGMNPDYVELPNKYIYFVKAAEIAKALNISGKNYVVANFELLEWTMGIPEPNQLITPNAKGRVIKWAAANMPKLKSDEVKKMVKKLSHIFKKEEEPW